MKIVRGTEHYCTFCEKTETLKEFKEHYICDTCVKEVNETKDRHKSNDSQ